MSTISPPRPIYHYILPGIFVSGLFVLLFLRIPEESRLFTLHGKTMGTTWMTKIIVTSKSQSSSQFQTIIQRELQDIDQRMSTYKPNSEISQFNQNKSTKPIALSTKTISVILKAQSISKKTKGAFDITIKPVVNAWGFGVGEGGSSPTLEDITLLMPIIGYQKLSIKENNLQKTHPDIEIDLSAIAKGYAVDRLAERLLFFGVENFMIEVGGEIRAQGLNHHGGLWRIGIEQPDAKKGVIQEVITLRNQAIATSGDYRNFYQHEGERISHTIDARTGRPIKHSLASVSVIHPSAMLADAWATALHVLGPEKGLQLAKKENLAVLMLIRHQEGGFIRKVSDAFLSQQVKKEAKPTKVSQ